MEKKQLSKANSPTEEPKKPIFSTSGCGCAVICLIGIFAFMYYQATGPMGKSYRQRGYDATAKGFARIPSMLHF